jgi:hypothetical protein
MKKLLSTITALMFAALTCQAQINVGINDDNSSPKPSAMLDIFSINKGLLIPRIELTSTAVALPVTTPEASLLVYNTATAGDVIPGYYYWDSSKWVRIQATGTGIQKLNTVTKTASGTIAQTDNMVFASGNITLTLPAVTSANDGLEISVKNVGTFTDLITVVPEAGKIIDAITFSLLTRWRSRTYVARGSNWIVKDKETRTDNLYDVSSSASFVTIAEVVAFLNEHMNGPSVVRLGGGTHQIASTQTINLPYPVTFEGISYGKTIITGSGSLFICATECYFKMLNFNGTSGNAITFTGSGVYYEVKDSNFDGFSKGIVSTASNDIWIFENDFENCTAAGIEIAAASGSDGRLRVSETDFIKCAKGINLLSGVSQTISIINSAFINTASGTDIGISYNPATFTPIVSMNISNNSWNNQGTFISGFDFARADGRDANAYLMNNIGSDNKNPHCKLSLLNNTILVKANGITYLKADWTATSPTLTTYTCKWNLTTTNRILYQSVQKSDVIMWISGNISSSGSNRTINIGICKNGVTTTRYGETSVRTAVGGQPYQFSTIVHLTDVGENDYYEIWFNTTAGVTDNIIISDLNWYVDAR